MGATRKSTPNHRHPASVRLGEAAPHIVHIASRSPGFLVCRTIWHQSPFKKCGMDATEAWRSYATICRLCLQKDGFMLGIFNHIQGRDRSIYKKIMDCTALQVSSRHMCVIGTISRFASDYCPQISIARTHKTRFTNSSNGVENWGRAVLTVGACPLFKTIGPFLLVLLS